MNDTPYLGHRKPRLNFDELKVQIAICAVPTEYIREQVTLPEILDMLAKVPDDQVRAAVAVHPNVKLDTLLRLLKDTTTAISLIVLIAAQPKITIEVLQKLATHKNPRVSEEAKGVLFIRSKGHIDIQDD